MADVMVDTESKNAKELLGQGIRAYILQDYNAAVSALSKASEILVTEHGDDLHESLGDVYLYYGKALLGLSREESEALGDAVPKNADEDSEEDDKESTEMEEGDEKGENGESEVKEEEEAGEEKEEGEAAVAGKTDSGVGEDGTAGTTDGSNGTAKEGEASGSGDADGADEKADNDEEPTDLQVAWEVLELAKKIYEKRGADGKKNLAETMTVLGEISLESENFEAAIADIKEGLQIQQKLFPKDSRTVAETYYKLGIAYSTNSQIDEAIQSFNDSLKYLQNRINSLKKVNDKKDEVEEEIDEIKSLIPDIEEKIADMKSYKDETLKKIVTAVAERNVSTGGASTSSAASSTKPASDISHLVKRKRKLDEIAEEPEKEAKANPAKKPPV